MVLRRSIAIPEEQENDFYRNLEMIKAFLGVDTDNKAIIGIILRIPRILHEAKMYKKFLEDIKAYEALYKQTKIEEEYI